MDQPNFPQNVNSDILPTSTLAIVSLVSAILGFTIVPVIGTIVALITGYMARGETRSLPPRASGDGLATAGIIMGWVGSRWRCWSLAFAAQSLISYLLLGFLLLQAANEPRRISVLPGGKIRVRINLQSLLRKEK